MNTLIEKLAEFLEMTIEQATKLYPILRQQFIWSEALRAPEIVSWVACFLSAIALILGFVFSIASSNEDCFVEKERIVVKKIVRISLIAFIISLTINLALNIATLLLAPDLMMLKEFIGG